MGILWISSIALKQAMAGSAQPRALPPSPYWCAEIRLLEPLPSSADGDAATRSVLETLNRSQISISTKDSCVWKVELLKTEAIQNAKHIGRNEKAEMLTIFGVQCSKLKTGEKLFGILMANETEQSSKADEGTLRNKAIYFRKCLCMITKGTRNPRLPSACTNGAGVPDNAKGVP